MKVIDRPANVKVVTVYSLAMAKYRFINIQLHGVEKAIVVEADSIEKDEDECIYRLKKNGNEVGQFNIGTVVAWWGLE